MSLQQEFIKQLTFELELPNADRNLIVPAELAKFQSVYSQLKADLQLLLQLKSFVRTKLTITVTNRSVCCVHCISCI